IEPDGLADDVGIRVETPTPQCEGDQGHARPARAIFLRRENAAKQRWDSPCGKLIGGHARAEDELRRSAIGYIKTRRHFRDKLVENIIAIFDFEIFRNGKKQAS